MKNIAPAAGGRQTKSQSAPISATGKRRADEQIGRHDALAPTLRAREPGNIVHIVEPSRPGTTTRTTGNPNSGLVRSTASTRETSRRSQPTEQPPALPRRRSRNHDWERR